MKINWRKEYKNEFLCPKCNTRGMKAAYIRKETGKWKFQCPNCGKVTYESQNISPIVSVADPINIGINWYTNHIIKGFNCIYCGQEKICFKRINPPDGKKRFVCKNCKKGIVDSHDLKSFITNRYSFDSESIKPFDFDQNIWDLRSISTNCDDLDVKQSKVSFSLIKQKWFKDKVKKYIQFLSKSENAYKTIQGHLSALRAFSKYLSKTKIVNYDQINRSVILDYFNREKTINHVKIAALRNFFLTGTLKGWFEFDQDIIRDEDYPKRYRGNPEPLSDVVREQIEQNLHKLPDPIVRMWIICFAAAMRPSELALLNRDCLIQEGQHWNLVWNRKKSSDSHCLPISRTIAKVVQQQQEYIEKVHGSDWDYLFCHYHGLSRNSLEQTKLKPIKTVLPSTHNNPLLVCINSLIKESNILDDNGNLAVFTNKIIRPTKATHLFEQGHELAIVTAWLGHKHFATTSTYYTKVSCDLIEQEAGHIQKALVNSEGHHILYESFPKSFWEKPEAHKLELSGTHINTPIYGYCGLDLDQDCEKFRACYTCPCFVATPEKLPQYIKIRDELRGKQSKALAVGQDVLVEQFGTQAKQLEKIIVSLQEAA